ncbi:hypothetical protein AN639_10435 [Candidatus Epulonipiscium fishelsonii]|uniref:Uncharacterized protein n=1 Tax=Candidatus Epulonipiscium fishelsonii TaxID=77094 RepID=A0ACC8XAA4_9FIRM|nr:hypothetical protein AN396_09055 [Epulopiscium sp. SCG-B11WGA-EpuloA1]ONI43511.1 hypothetical protein AN639_10435 [Epulopiscium sp. SCG-B05WGA-EpuloA1]
MNDLTLTQQYTLCAMKNNGEFGEWHSEDLMLEVAAVLELVQRKLIKFRNDQTIKIVDKLNLECSHLQPVYEIIQENEPMEFDELIEEFENNYNADVKEDLFENVKNILMVKGALVEDKNSRWDDEPIWYPKNNVIKLLMEKLRPNSICNAIGETEALLATLLSDIGVLRKNFSESEIEILKDQVDDMSENNPALFKKLNFIKAAGGNSLQSSVQSLGADLFSRGIELLKDTFS